MKHDDKYVFTPVIHNMYAIYDEKACIFNKPFCVPTHGQAMRAFGENLNDPQNMIAKYPADFKLYYIGRYDEGTAQMHNLETPPQLLATGTDYTKKPVLENQDK